MKIQNKIFLVTLSCVVVLTAMLFFVGVDSVASAVCGDGLCDGTELCLTCPSDCGACAVDSALCDSRCGGKKPDNKITRNCCDGGNTCVTLYYGRVKASCWSSNRSSICWLWDEACISCDSGGYTCVRTHWTSSNKGSVGCDSNRWCVCDTHFSGPCPGDTYCGNGTCDPGEDSSCSDCVSQVACGVVECTARILGYSSYSPRSSSCSTPFTGWTVNSSFTVPSLTNCSGTTCYCGAGCDVSCPLPSTYCAGETPDNGCGGLCYTTGTKTFNCGSDCTPWCPSPWTYCAEDTPSNRCGSLCTTGTKTSNCGSDCIVNSSCRTTTCVGDTCTGPCGNIYSGTMSCAPTSVGHVRIQGPSGYIRLSLISASNAKSQGRGVIKVARFNGDTNSAADLVQVNASDASRVRVRTQYGTFAWREL